MIHLALFPILSLICCLLLQSGVVSDDELLDLLYLAMSSDASNTVRKARELMGSGVDPLELTSQLASLIMDILAGKCPSDGVSETRRRLFGSDNCTIRYLTFL